MNHLRNHIAILSVLILLVGCGRAKELAYFHDAPRDTTLAIGETHPVVVHKGDVLHIYVSSQDPQSVIPFNEETNRLAANARLQDDTPLHLADLPPTATPQTASAIGHQVDNQGRIFFPVLGPLQVEGLTHDSLAAHIRHRLMEEGLVADPIVSIRLLNFRVAVLGEVNQPRWVHAQGTRLTILEALAMVGDMTLYGQRHNVKVIREVNGQAQVGTLDLTSADLFHSPYYYLQQNDIVFVEPNRKRKKESSRNEYLSQYISLGVGVGTLGSNTARMVYTILRHR